MRERPLPEEFGRAFRIFLGAAARWTGAVLATAFVLAGGTGMETRLAATLLNSESLEAMP
jgi:hypothetical protein